MIMLCKVSIFVAFTHWSLKAPTIMLDWVQSDVGADYLICLNGLLCFYVENIWNQILLWWFENDHGSLRHFLTWYICIYIMSYLVSFYCKTVFVNLTVHHMCVTAHNHFWWAQPWQYKAELIIHQPHSLVMSCGDDVVPPPSPLHCSRWASDHTRQVTIILFIYDQLKLGQWVCVKICQIGYILKYILFVCLFVLT